MMRNSEIPKFDLADEIMAEQRKISATRRKAPSKKDDASSQQGEVTSIDPAVVQSTPLFREQLQIITEIVAKDIAKLCGDSTSVREQRIEDRGRISVF